MPRTKKEVSTTAFDAVEEKVENQSTVEVTETEVSENAVKTAETETEVKNEDKPKENASEPVKFYDDDTVKVKSVKRAGKTITANTGRAIQFDSNGLAEVTGMEAKYLLTCPGFELAK